MARGNRKLPLYTTCCTLAHSFGRRSVNARPRPHPRSVQMRILLDELLLAHVFLRAFRICPVSSIRPVSSTHLYLYATLTRRTQELSQRTFQQSIFFGKVAASKIKLFQCIHDHTHTHARARECVCVCVCMCVYIYIFFFWHNNPTWATDQILL